MGSFSSIFIDTLSNYGRQALFAIAPIPAYLPQYLTLCRESNDPILQRQLKRSGSSSETDEKTIAMGHQRGGRVPITEGGFSSTSIMILLISHAFRLQYFLGSAIINRIGVKSGNKGIPSPKAEKVHTDLVMQSIVMMCIQFLLLSAVTRRRRLSNKRKIDREDQVRVSPMKLPIMSSSAVPNKASSISQRPFIWLVKPRNHWYWDTIRQYIELIVILSLMNYIFVWRFLYPNDVLNFLSFVKVVSVLLESCLALPQMILNHKRKSTEGLSVVMVLGWVVGDLLKLVYFIISSREHPNQDIKQLDVISMPEESDDMTAFIFGCISALMMDFIVGYQVTSLYPSLDMVQLRDKFKKIRLMFEIKILRIDPTEQLAAINQRRNKSRTYSEDGNIL
uniref:Uncharacterized protein n=1 Tax=Chaetoceros debilis TaxID=122233 RepID=A0A7S3QJX8_9STRA|mmetsp:Transcript_9288/g.13884  ORF Transcript_9288/g.13884 Transcript_9288/m.13884 type:complete len:393 (+) Transcript_9288:287-1465(+)